jgi:hypothetical protein
MDDVRKTVAWLLDMLVQKPASREFVEEKLVHMLEDSVARANTTPMKGVGDGEWSDFSAAKERHIAP